jgi:hypothetical protein
MADPEQSYKRLRNHLRKTELVDSLAVVRAYFQNLQFRRPFPSDIEVPRFYSRLSVSDAVHEWELAALAREVILNASERPAEKTLREWNYFAGAINKVKEFENDLVDIYPKGSILRELHRIAHRQFVWQRRPNAKRITRYFQIFSRPAVNELVTSLTGLNTLDIYLIGLALLGIYFDKFALNYPPNITIPTLDQGKLHRFEVHFSRELATIRATLQESSKIDANYIYSFNPLEAYPLVRMLVNGRESLVAPIPTFLFRRFTDGLYYEIRGADGFDAAFGDAFQWYVGEVIARANTQNALTVYPETEYLVGRDRRRTVDWLIRDETGVVFLECKTKRLRFEAKSDITTASTLEEETDKLAQFIVQTYRGIRDYFNGAYPYGNSPRVPVFPIIVTLEEWYAFGPEIFSRLDARVAARLMDAGISADWAREFPYSFCSIEDFEALVQVIAMRGIDTVIGLKTRGEERQWIMSTFLHARFPEDYKKSRTLFPEVLDAIWPPGVDLPERSGP